MGEGSKYLLGVGTGLWVNPSLGLMAGNHGEPWERRLWHSSGCQISGVKALWMERRLVWEVGWGVSLSSASFLLSLHTLQSVQQPSSCQGLPGLRRPLGSTRNQWGGGGEGGLCLLLDSP